MEYERSAALLVSCQQTRFYLAEGDTSTEIDVKNLSIIIPTDREDAAYESSSLKVKGKSKAKSEGLEILSGAELRLKTGVHYAMVGRNGTGKSTILRAIAEKLVPGIPLRIRIAILQQASEDSELASWKKTVLQQVVEGDTYRNRILEEADILSQATDSGDPLAPVKAYRQIRHANLERDFLEVQKMAKLRSGARGLEARKVLIAYEKKVSESSRSVSQSPSEIDPSTVESETNEAVSLLETLQSELTSMTTSSIESKARHTLLGLGFKESQFSAPFSSLSGGWRMRCLLAAALVQTSDLLILDEPTNYLDLLGILWLEHHLSSLQETSPSTTVILVSHDRDFVNAAASETIILRDKSLTYFAGNLSSYEKSVRREALRLSRMKESSDKQKAQLEKQIQHNMKHARKTGDDKAVKQAKSKQRKLDDRMGLQVSAKGTRFKLNRDLPGYYLTSRAEIEVPTLDDAGVAMHFPEPMELRFPGSLVSLEKVSLTYKKAARATLEDVDLVVGMGDKVGILGLNGAGKSTLVRVLVGDLKYSKGMQTSHPRVRIGYYSQHSVEALKALGTSSTELTALAHILGTSAEGGEGLSEQDARALLSGLGLSGRTASDVPVAKLSGGQLVRLALAQIFLKRPHLLVMDEPTTHLDLPTVHALTRALVEFKGAVVLVSHDRYLIRCVVEREPVDDSSGSEDSEESEMDEEKGVASQTRRLVYELKGGKLVEKSGGVSSFETGLEGRLKKMGI